MKQTFKGAHCSDVMRPFYLLKLVNIVRLKQEIGHQSERDDNANERIFTIGQHASIDCKIIFGMLVEFI